MTRVIIVPGLDSPRWPWPFNFLIKLYCWYFGLTGAGNDWSKFKAYAERMHFEVVLRDPLRWFSNKEIDKEGAKLAQLIDESPKNLVFVGYSLGTSVIESGIKKCAHPERVKEILSIASPHKTKSLAAPDSIKVVNIYSDADTYLDFSNRMLYRRGYKELEHAKNIKLDNLKHSDFTNPAQFKLYADLL